MGGEAFGADPEANGAVAAALDPRRGRLAEDREVAGEPVGTRPQQAVQPVQVLAHLLVVVPDPCHVGDGRRDPAWCAGLLAERERSSRVPVADARGLCLIGVDYPPDEQLASRNAITRDVRKPGCC